VLKTNSCTDLANQSGKSVVAAGWIAKRRDHGGVAFFDLRDATGVVQVVVHDADLAHSLKTESCVAITGKVQARPEGNENSEIPTGKVELVAESIQIFSSAGPLPFQIDESDSVGDELRLKYRYLDLRRPEMASKLKLRSRANAIARNVLLKENFVEVETPTFTRSTPEGARDFLVPVRLQPGKWYALPQSPQLYKQLLMVAGLERYFQIARCYRDEDFRADRQPEFTQ
jgi:aspartyl-tRNA synthetase